MSRFGRRAPVVCLGVLLTAAAVTAAITTQPGPRSVVIAADSSTPGRLTSKRYWADHGRNAIRRSNLDGSQAEDVVTGVSGPYGLGFDATKRLFVWTNSADEVVQAASPEGFAPMILQSSFEDTFAIVTANDTSEIAYAVLDGELVKLTQDRQTGAEQRVVLLRLDSPDAVHGLALAADGSALYLGDAVGQMSRKLRLADRVVETIAFAGGAAPVPDPEPADAGQELLK